MILDDIIAQTYQRISDLPAGTSGTTSGGGKSLLAALRASQSGTAVIAEIKRASPSAGAIAMDCAIEETARELTAGGAAALSVLTEPYFFGGSPQYIGLARRGSSLPILRKDFIINVRQLYETSRLGADAVLLVAGLLRDRLPEFVDLSYALGIEPLVEVHTMAELPGAVRTRAECIGINNRDLYTMRIDLDTTVRLSRAARDSGKLVVSESGIRSASDIRRLKPYCDAFLVGSSLMEAPDRKGLLQELVCA